MKFKIFFLFSFGYVSNLNAKMEEGFINTLTGQKITKEFCTPEKISELQLTGERIRKKAQSGIRFNTYLEQRKQNKVDKKLAKHPEIKKISKVAGKIARLKVLMEGSSETKKKKKIKDPLVEEYERLQREDMSLRDKSKLSAAEYIFFSAKVCRLLVNGFQITKQGRTLATLTNHSVKEINRLEKKSRRLIKESNRLTGEFSRSPDYISKEHAQELIPIEKQQIANSQSILSTFKEIKNIQDQVINGGFKK